MSFQAALQIQSQQSSRDGGLDRQTLDLRAWWSEDDPCLLHGTFAQRENGKRSSILRQLNSKIDALRDRQREAAAAARNNLHAIGSDQFSGELSQIEQKVGARTA